MLSITDERLKKIARRDDEIEERAAGIKEKERESKEINGLVWNIWPGQKGMAGQRASGASERTGQRKESAWMTLLRAARTL